MLGAGHAGPGTHPEAPRTVHVALSSPVAELLLFLWLLIHDAHAEAWCGG